jgi:hypothetical protein
MRLRVLAAIAVSLLASCEGGNGILCGSDTKSTGAGCVTTYELCRGGTYRLQCDPAQGSVQCACIEDDALKTTFRSSADTCKVSSDALRRRASAGCNWVLE